jgi:uncharacterized membrane protein YagU involved in acid resistance
MFSGITRIILAGLAGEAVFEALAWGVAPVLVGQPTQPALLVQTLAANVLGVEVDIGAAFAIHLLVGVALFPAGYAALRRRLPVAPLALGALYGVVLWFLAQGMLAPLAGRPFMLGFAPYSMVSLGFHLAYAMTVAGAYAWLTGRREAA